MKSVLTAGCLFLAVYLCGCGGSSSSTSTGTVSLEVSPTSVVVPTSSTQQFTAKVKNASNSNVTWQVNSVTGGSATYGTISGTGLYTAPSSVPNSATVTVTAISVADSNKTADAAVTIAVPVSVSPASVTVEASVTQQFTAAVSFSSNTDVTWQVNGSTGGNSTFGTITTGGLYAAPNSVPSPNPVSVTAVAKADTSKSASAEVTIAPPPIVISPSTATLVAAEQVTFTATVLSNTVHPTWNVSCGSPAPVACGTITSDGVYTAPRTPPRYGNVTITASLADGSATTKSASASVRFGNATLSGTYVFALRDEIGNLAPVKTGAIVFDGAGNVTGGAFDSSDSPGVPRPISSGTYSVSSDGRGTAAFSTPSETIHLQFVLGNQTLGSVVRTDSGANQSAGALEAQSNSTIADGAYVLSVSGTTAGLVLTEAGTVVLSGGAVAGGSIDLKRNLNLQSLNISGGSYTPAPNGRGTLTFTTSEGSQTFAFYPISATRARVVAIDGATTLGELSLQRQGSFASSTLKGRYVFLLGGRNSGNLLEEAGVFSLDGAKSVTDQQFDGIGQTIFDFGPGAYAVTDAATGRTLVSWTADGGSPVQYILYPRSDGSFVMMESDARYSALGISFPQADATVLNLFTLQAAFAFELGGSKASNPSSGVRMTGQLTTASNASITGTFDGTDFTSESAVSFTVLTQNAAAQRYVLGATTDLMAGRTLIVYRINDAAAFIIESSATRTSAGTILRQY